MKSYEDAIQAAVQKEADVLGREKAIGLASDIDGLEVGDDGTVVDLSSPGKIVLEKLVESYEKIGGEVTASLIARELRNRKIDEIDLPEELQERL